MFKIYDGRDCFYQWDSNRKLIVDDESIKQVHFCNRTGECSLVCETYKEDNKLVVDVPNILLQQDWRIRAYAYDGNATLHEALYDVKRRTKPDNYIYTETEVLNYTTLSERMRELEEGNFDLTGYATEEYVQAEIEKIELMPGEKGEAGEPGVSATHAWNGTILSITSASGTSSADLKGEPGEKGAKGDEGFYVGDTEPTDDSLVWIDPSAGATDGLATMEQVETAIEEALKDIDVDVDLTGYATEEYVGTAITDALKDVDVDLTGYATEEYVNTAIGNLDIPEAEVDLSGYYTKEEIDTILSNLPVGDIPSGEEVEF